MEIKNKTVMITGGASGMGAATAIRFANAGANVVLLDRNIELAEKLAKDLKGVAVSCDVTDEADVQNAVKIAVSNYGAIHVLVNCAGIATAARVVSKEGAMPIDEFQKTIQVNLIGTFNVLRLVADQMLKQPVINDDNERGVIINTASVAAYDGQLGQAAYSASKGAVVAMTLPIAREFAKSGIRIMCIAPGIMKTPMMDAMPEKVQASLAEAIPFPKRMGQAEEYAKLAQHLVENAYLNAETIRLDAGIRMQ